MSALTPLVIASGNAGKVREFAGLLVGLPVETRPQPEGLEVAETGATFAENARLKAEAVACATGCWALADDSGLAVEALGGAPGVLSARYAPTDAERIARLLADLTAVGATTPDQRGAAFVAALALADPRGTVRLAVEGRCGGRILDGPRGRGGFGYDPVFEVPDLALTFAEMDKATKGRVGHRGRAFALLEPGLRELLGLV